VTTRRRVATALAAFGALVAAVVVGATPASAHPLGNFTVNLYSGLRVDPGAVRIDHVVDLAEIPAFQAKQEVDTDGDGRVSDAEAASWRRTECARRGSLLRLRAGGRELGLRVESSDLAFPPGVGGLTTLRLQCEYVADLDGATSLTFADEEDPARVGWHEVTAVGDRTTLSRSDVPAASTSRRLTTYPKDLLTSPLDVRTASVSFTAGGAAAAPVDPGTGSGVRAVDAATRAYVGLLGRAHLTPLFVLLALALSVLLGGLHAIAPGHGKTLMAGYLLGAGGRTRDALTIAGTVTATHTVGVLVLGVVVAGSYAAAPERLYPLLSGGGGLLAVVVGLALVRRARTGGPGHTHGPDGHHHHHDHDHPHSQSAPSGHGQPQHGGVALATHPVGTESRVAVAAPAPSRRSLVSLGLAGGMVPSPSALLVLLAGVALHRTWLGVVLVVAYGAGMALTLCAAGLLVLRARAVSTRVPALAGSRFVRLLPVVAGLVVAVAGLQLVVRAGLALT